MFVTIRTATTVDLPLFICQFCFQLYDIDNPTNHWAIQFDFIWCVYIWGWSNDIKTCSARYSLQNVSRGVSRFSKQCSHLFLSTGRNVEQVSKSIHHISVHLTIPCFGRSKKLIPLSGSLTILSMFLFFSRL